MKIILASQSKRRFELMKLLEIPFEVMVSDDEEIYDSSKTVYEQCMDISYHKALNIYKKTNGNRIIIGVDTIVVMDNKIYGKPKNLDDAVKMIQDFSGKCHEVVSAVTILVNKDNNYYEEKLYEKTKVYVDLLEDKEIIDWVNNHQVLDKAGSYAIQESFGKHISKIEGDYYTIVGMPLNKIYLLLKKYYENSDIILKNIE